MAKGTLSSLVPSSLGEPDLLERIQRRRRYRAVGSVGALTSILLFVATKLIPQAGGPATTVLATILAASLMLIGVTRLWFRESREPFRYTYSVGAFDLVAGDVAILGPARADGDPIEWLTRDLTKKLSERVQRLSLLEEESVPEADADGASNSHVHITGWYGFRRADGWELEVVPKVRLGGAGAPAKLARAVRFKLCAEPASGGGEERPQPLSEDDYQMLFERVYWSVASQIYAQIHQGVEEKVNLLPSGALRASAFIHEADDYATSNTLDAYEAARKLYRQALEIYEIGFRKPPATPWRERMTRLLIWFTERRRDFRSWRAGIWRRAGRREVMTARAELGLARMLVGEWHLRQLCGMVPKEIYEAAVIVESAIARLDDVPNDVRDQPLTLFRAHVARATIRLFLRDRPGARAALEEAERLFPDRAREEADFLFAAGMIEPDQLLSLRLLGQAVEQDPTMERALFHRAQQFNDIWRRRDKFEPEVAETVDAEYRAVIALNPGNLSAWAQRGYLGWLLSEEEASPDSHEDWRRRAIDALEAGRQYKEVRQEATVAELDWTLARLAAEKGEFVKAYKQYILAVSAKLGAPRIEFENDYYLSPTEALVERYQSYQRRVMEEARKAEERDEISPRLIRSVKAFVLNDCGLAYQAHYDRSGREQDLIDAREAFEDARRENSAFVLPTYNLAKLHRQQSELPGGSSAEATADLRRAAELLEKVLGHEPDWAPAQLLMIEVQAALAADLHRELELAREQGKDGTLAGSFPVAETAPAEGSDAAVATGARVSHLAALRDGYHASLEQRLRKLLPHRQLLTPTGVHRVDARGTYVHSLVEDPALHWTKDFSNIHVAAFVQWSKVLVVTSPRAANLICEKLRASYYRADVDLLHVQRDAAESLVGHDADGDGDIDLIVADCEDLLRELVRAALREDPAHLLALQRTTLLPAPERRQALRNARAANPSATALIWVGDAQLKLDDVEDALQTYEQAVSEGGKSIAPVASLRLAGQLEGREEGRAKAIAAYRAAAESSDAPIAAEGRAGAARLLYGEGDDEGAKAEYREAASRLEVVLPLANLLEKEGRQSDVIDQYREALASAGGGGALRAEVRLRLALALMVDQDGRVPESEMHLREVAATDFFPVGWEAAVLLARMLPEAERDEAERLYRRALEETDPAAKIVATWELGGIFEANEEAPRARELYLEQSRSDHRVAARIAELRRERGDADVDQAVAADPVPG